MKNAVAALAVAFLVGAAPSFALAQAQTVEPAYGSNRPTEAQLDASQSLSMLTRSLQRMAQDEDQLRAQVAAMQKHQADLDTYLKACGDRPGCTQPVTK